MSSPDPANEQLEHITAPEGPVLPTGAPVFPPGEAVGLPVTVPPASPAPPTIPEPPEGVGIPPAKP